MNQKRKSPTHPEDLCYWSYTLAPLHYKEKGIEGLLGFLFFTIIGGEANSPEIQGRLR